MNSNAQQEAILNSTSKRVVVLACPGSGKTTTITKKIIQLYKNGISLKRILSVTFTRRAAKEMYERLVANIPISKSEQKNISTLHSFGCRILYKYKDVAGLKEEFVVANKIEKEEIAKEVLKKIGPSQDVIQRFLEYVSCVKNGIEVKNDDFLKEYFDEYCSKMIDSNLIDLDDYIYLPVKILNNNDHIKETISKKFDYVFVDEYQDINKIQNDFLDLIINENTSVIYVGDDDQSIYEFRGSNPNYILEKSKKDSGYDVYFLTTNYRSQKPIVDLSIKILSQLKTTNRNNKEIVAFKNTSLNKPVRNYPFDNKAAEIDFVANEIYRLITESNVEPREIAVLFRYSSKKNGFGIINHPELKDLDYKLKQKGIPVSTSLYLENDNDSSKYIKNLCNVLLMLSKNEIDPNHCNLIIQNSYNKEKFTKILEAINLQYKSNYSEKEPFINLMEEIIKLNPQLEGKNFTRRLDKLIKAYNFYKEQFDLVKKGAMPSAIIANIITFNLQNKMSNETLDEIFKYAYSFAKSSEQSYEIEDGDNEYLAVINSMNAFLCSIEKGEDNNCVRLLTAHQSKGLQFDVVFVVGLEAGGFPSNIEKLTDDNLDNERRLFYVCVTRARELLYLSSTQYTTELDSSLADKSFIYSIPEKYFSTNVEKFDGIDFTISDIEKAKNIKEKDEMIDDLEADIFLYQNRLSETLRKIEILEQENKEISQNIEENKTFQDQIKLYKEQIIALKNSSTSKDNYLDKLQNELKLYRNKEIEYNNRIKKLSESNNSQTNEKEKITKELLLIKETFKKTNSKYLEMLQKLDDANIRIKEFEEQVHKLESTESKKELSKTVAEELDTVSENIHSINSHQNKIDVIFSSIVNFDESVMDDQTKQYIKKIFEVLVEKNRYPCLKAYFECGLETLENLIKRSYEYINSKIDKNIFETYLRSFNYKGNLDELVKKILMQLTDYSQLKSKSDFAIIGFLDASLGCNSYGKDLKSDSKYKKILNNFKKSSHFKPIDNKILEDMYVLNAITSTCNHDRTIPYKELHVTYKKVVEKFLNNPSINYYSIFLSYFKFISLFIDDDSLMLFVK